MAESRAFQNGRGLRLMAKDETAAADWLAFCQMLQERRVALGITRPQLGEKLGITLSVLGKWERAERAPHPHDMVRWMRELGVELDMKEL